MDIPDKNGCLLSVTDENASLEIRGSMSIPIGVIDSGKVVTMSLIVSCFLSTKDTFILKKMFF